MLKFRGKSLPSASEATRVSGAAAGTRQPPSGHPFTGNLLPADLAPAATYNVGAMMEEYYDAEGDFELGDLIEWFDIWVGNQETTVFEAL